jgi:thiol-disulfide isomerase/thioredoxin
MVLKLSRHKTKMRLLSTLIKGLLALVLAVLLFACAGDKAPNIIVTGLLNPQQQLNLSSPNKPVLLNFWATSCPSCIEEIPGLVALQQTFGDKIAVVGVAMDYDEPAQLRAFATQRKLPYMIVHDSNRQIAQGFGNIYVTPTNILLNAQGEIVWKGVGTPDFAALSQRIKTIL